MATYIRKLKSADGNWICPATRTKAIYLDNDTDLQTWIESVNTNISNINTELDKSVTTDNLFPVGAIYHTTNGTSPASKFGGSWEKIQGKFLLGTSSSHSVNTSGGEETHKLTVNEMPSHNHGSKSLTGSFWNLAYQDSNWLGGAASGIVSKRKPTNLENVNAACIENTTERFEYDGFNIDATHTHSSNGGNAAHNNMPPFYSVHIWRRVS